MNNLKPLVTELLDTFAILEESDSGREFHPVVLHAYELQSAFETIMLAMHGAIKQNDCDGLFNLTKFFFGMLDKDIGDKTPYISCCRCLLSSRLHEILTEIREIIKDE